MTNMTITMTYIRYSIFLLLSILTLFGFYTYIRYNMFNIYSSSSLSPLSSKEGNKWLFQEKYICKDIREGWDPIKIEKFIEERQSFYYKLTDRLLNEEEWRKGNKTFDLLGPINDLCPNKSEEMGLEKRLCEIPKDDTDCIVISLGGGNQWEFEKTVYDKTKCKIRTFDCTLDLIIPNEIKDRTIGYQYCISDDKPHNQSYNGKMVEFIDWKTMLEDIIGLKDKPPTILKIDIEGYEFGVLRSIFKSEKHYPSQIAIEFHFHALEKIQDVLLFIQYLWNAGYIALVRVDNPYCSSCTDLLLKRIFCYN